jgi:hypothetical protein
VPLTLEGVVANVATNLNSMKSTDSSADSSRALIVALIREDLKCNKLVLGLSELGLDAGKYHLTLIPDNIPPNSAG